jgi:cytochrome P450
MSQRPPVADWITDFDHIDPRWTENPYPIWDDLRQKCPVAHSERYLGVYLVTSYEACRTIAYDTEHFSSRRVMVRSERVEPPIQAPPITSDPPHHRPAKQILLPYFTLAAVKKLESKTRQICNELIDRFIADGRCDAAMQYSRHVPTRVIAAMMGIPEKDSDLFIKWVHEILELGITDTAMIMGALREMSDYFVNQIELRKKHPTDDLITSLMQVQHEGKPFSAEHVVATLRLLLLAAIDTTWSAIGASLCHLAKTPADRERLIAEPELMPTAIEEFLRAFAPVIMAREVVKETTICGCPIKPGNMMLLPFPAANRDPSMFPQADKVIIDRKDNRHATFGLGIHRCVGSNLARMELRVGIEEWLKRIPQFRLDPSLPVQWSEGTVRGPRRLPILFGQMPA